MKTKCVDVWALICRHDVFPPSWLSTLRVIYVLRFGQVELWFFICWNMPFSDSWQCASVMLWQESLDVIAWFLAPVDSAVEVYSIRWTCLPRLSRYAHNCFHRKMKLSDFDERAPLENFACGDTMWECERSQHIGWPPAPHGISQLCTSAIAFVLRALNRGSLDAFFMEFHEILALTVGH